MKHLQLLTLLGFATLLLAGCESTDLAQHRRAAGNQEAQRIAAAERERQEAAQVDESERNLWNAQHDILTRDGNPNTRFY
jgi:type IV pilus biogenesis protein CpaD/CtpE